MMLLSLFTRRGFLAALYMGAASLFFTISFVWGSWAWCTLWPGIDCAIVGVAYGTGNPEILAERRGVPSLLSRLLLLPYLSATRFNSWCWVRGLPVAVEVCEGVWLGRVPSATERRSLGMGSIVNLAPEMPARLGGTPYRAIAMLDLIVPDSDRVDLAVAAINSFKAQRPTLICCALGYSRSAFTLATWLLANGCVLSGQEAISALEELPRRVVLSSAYRSALALWATARRTT